MSNPNMDTFRERLGEVYDLRAATALSHWDMEVNMPPKGGPARGKQLATLSALTHRLFTAEEFGGLLHRLHEMNDKLAADEATLVAETLYDYERARKLPEAFVQRLAEEESKAYQVWVKAREASDFQMFQPNLETLVDLARQRAEYLGYEDTPYDALLEDYERGMTAGRLQETFDALLPRQKRLVARIAAAGPQTGLDWLEGAWEEDAQWRMTLRVLEDMGYDFAAGRQDRSVHPFTTNFDIGDVRITTRVNASELFSCLTGSIHEGGHALYEQGFREEDRRTTLAEAPSLGIHESQSRMWENMAGRSLPFWEHYTPLLRQHFPGRLDTVSPEQVYRAINQVRPSLIRVEADECTYNLHIILRFEIEKALVEGDLAAGEVPGAWNEKMKDYLGLDVPDDARGCLQDIHWSHGSFGYFPTYALGNLYAAQLFEQISEDVPGLWEHVRRGDFAPLLGWLRTQVHRAGRRKTAVELVRDATGREPGPDPFLRYLEGKYEALYELG